MNKTNHEWASDAFFAKAQLYAEAMFDHQDSDWQFGLWSAFTLEMLVRSAVAATSPALIADMKDWKNVLFALGHPPTKSKFLAKSASITELVKRIQDIHPNFTGEHANFCVLHFDRRNSEVHSGDMPFENLGTSNWLPEFFSVCAVLLDSIGESLDSLFGTDLANQAREDIEAFEDKTAKSVRGTIESYKEVWGEKDAVEKEIAVAQAHANALRSLGHRVNCPACDSTALVTGKPAGAAKRSVEDGEIVERQAMKPDSFVCVACGLRIAGYSKLLAGGLGDTYTSTSHYQPIEYFEADIDEHIDRRARSMMEDDNNEY